MIAKFKKYKLIIFILCLCPVLIIGILHFGNFLFRVLGLNINPVGIDNIVWFSFFSSFIGGLCTLIAFILSNESNEKNLANTFDENKRHIKYQQVMLEIEQEQKIISKAIYSLKPLKIISLFNQFRFNAPNNEKMIELIGEVNREQEEHLKIRTELELQSDIIRNCKACTNKEQCNLSSITLDFTDLYYYCHNNIFNAYADFSNLLIRVTENFISDKNIEKANSVLSNCFESRSNKKNAKEMLEISTKRIKDWEVEFEKLESNIEALKKIHLVEINKLIFLSKSYKAERQKRASEKLDGNSILMYVEDAEKSEMLRKEYEEKQKQILEKVENKQEV